MRKGFFQATAVVTLAILGLTGLNAAAGAEEDGQQRGNAGMDATQDRSSNSEAEALYVEECSMCHRAFGMGTTLLARRLGPDKAMLESRDNLTAPFVILVAREGIGNMPRMSRGEVSDEELQQIADYLAGGPY